MKVLVGCEESGTLSGAFRDAGHDAMSCDLLPTRGDPNHHIVGDIAHVLRQGTWDLIVLHPPCTALACSGNRWYGKGRPRHTERVAALAWTRALWTVATTRAARVAMENPVGVLFPAIMAQVCWVQPWEHGHGETKRTGFALHSLPALVPSNIVDGRRARVHKMGEQRHRARLRSETYPGIARAIVEQWGT